VQHLLHPGWVGPDQVDNAVITAQVIAVDGGAAAI
jgi:hypothetical protein